MVRERMINYKNTQFSLIGQNQEYHPPRYTLRGSVIPRALSKQIREVEHDI